MNLCINRLDNFKIEGKSYQIVPSDEAKELNLSGAIIGVDAEYLINDIDAMFLIKKSELRLLMGEYMYQALIRKPMMLFLMPTQEDEFEGTKEEFDKRYGNKTILFNNFAQAFSIGCWFIKDSCVSSAHIYWLNLINGYYSQGIRHMDIMLSDGTIAETYFDDSEMREACARMFQVYRYLLPDDAHTDKVNMTTSGGTVVWEIDKAMSTEGKSFARALMILQEARRTGVLATRIDKYCSVLECLYAINKDHKKNISQITAAYIGKDASERDVIVLDMRDAYGVRSDGSHGENLKYLRDNDREALANLSKKLDGYVRRVFTKVIADETFNYDATDGSKVDVRARFRTIMQSIYTA